MLAFELIPDALENKGKELAGNQAEYETLEKNEKTVLASIMMKQEGSISNREMIARANQEYKDFLDTIKTARRKMLVNKAEINWLETAFEWYRSSNANERARINLR